MKIYYPGSLLVLFFIFTQTGSFAQKTEEDNLRDGFIAVFNYKLDTALWLCEYDNIAWITSDEVLSAPKKEQAKLGQEWFCFKQENVWHACYGNFSNAEYQIVFHYVVDEKQKIERVDTPVDTAMSNAFCRVLINGKTELQDYPDANTIRFNQYIKRNDDQTITVWFLPAFTEDGIAVFGGEFWYKYDSTGKQLISKFQYAPGYKGYKPDTSKNVWIDNSELDEPTVGSIFFIAYYKAYFNQIIVESKNFTSSVITDNKNTYWVHTRKN